MTPASSSPPSQPLVTPSQSGARRSGVTSLVVGLALSLALGGCRGGVVVRVHDGAEVPGRFISDRAYGAYARGAEHEARGELAAGLDAYLEAAASDPASVEIWTRVGALRCRLERYDQATEAFAEAESRDARYEPLWRERALCADHRGDEPAALAAAAHAVELDPERGETVLLYARLLETQGEASRAGRWLRDLAISTPHEVSVWQALRDHARRAKDERWAAHAAAQLRLLGERLAQPRSEASPRSRWALVDAALQAGDLPVARRQARRAGFHPSLLAVRAIVVGRADLAVAEAELRVEAEPTDTDSRIALALATDLTGQHERTSRRFGDLPVGATAPTEVGQLMLGELLLRHVGVEAAQAWLGRPVAAPPGGTGTLRERLRAQLQSQGGER